MRGVLRLRDNKYCLDQLAPKLGVDSNCASSSDATQQQEGIGHGSLWGTPKAAFLLQLLQQHGIRDGYTAPLAKTTNQSQVEFTSSFVLVIPSLDATLCVSSQATRVVTTKEASRLLLAKLISGSLLLL